MQTESSSGHWLVESAGSVDNDDKHWNANLCKSMQKPDKTEKCLCLKVKLEKYMHSIILAIQISNNTWMNNFNLSCVFYYRWRKAWVFSSQGLLRISLKEAYDWLYDSHRAESRESSSDEVFAHYFSVCVYLGESKRERERETEGVWTDLLHHPSAPNETITALACPSAIQKH